MKPRAVWWSEKQPATSRHNHTDQNVQSNERKSMDSSRSKWPLPVVFLVYCHQLNLNLLNTLIQWEKCSEWVGNHWINTCRVGFLCEKPLAVLGFEPGPLRLITETLSITLSEHDDLKLNEYFIFCFKNCQKLCILVLKLSDLSFKNKLLTLIA